MQTDDCLTGPPDDLESDQGTNKVHGMQKIASTSEKDYRNDSEIGASPSSAEIHDRDENVGSSQLLQMSFLSQNGCNTRVSDRSYNGVDSNNA